MSSSKAQRLQLVGASRASARSGWNSSIGLPEGSSTNAWLPPTPWMMSLRKRTPPRERGEHWRGMHDLTARSFRGRDHSAWSLVIPAGGFEQLDWITRWVLEQDLSNSDSAGLVVAEVDTCAAQGLDRRVKVGDLDQDAIPSPGCGKRAVGQRVPAWVGARYAQQQSQVAAIQHREHRAGSQLLREAQILAIEVDRGIDFLD